MAKLQWRVGILALAIWLVAGETASVAETVTLQFYSTVPRNLSDPLIRKFSELNPGITASLFQAGVETVLEKMELEIRANGRTQADVMWIEEPAAMAQFAADGVLAPQDVPDLANILPAYRDPQGRFVANHVAHVLIMYHTGRVSAQQAPQAWQDLTQGRYANQLVFSNPRISGTGAIIAAAMVQAFGWPFWEKIATLKPTLINGSQGMTAMIIQGERPIGAMQDYTIGEAMRKGQPVGYVMPAEGAVALPAYVGVAAGSKHPEAARRFYEFMISRDAATMLLSLGMFHTRADMPGPEGWPAASAVKTMPFDWTLYARTKPEVKARFSDLMEQ
jgi:iron(III) transport system substrate-binding protein